MTEQDLDGVFAVACAIHEAYPERREVFAERLALFPGGCWVLTGSAGPVGGYAVSHPWRAGEPVPLDALIAPLPAEATRYIHDIAVLPRLRGAGAAGTIVRRIVRDAYRANAPSASLVAVSGTVPFWQGHGFVVQDDPRLAEKLAGYGGDARYMVRDLRL
ncbi:GNAT family N-acetyltransferase [Alsobacter sp. R-9]